MIDALLSKHLKNTIVLCQACSHFCRLGPGQTGRCRARQNKAGRLVSLVGYKAAACHIDPVEKKPLYHFLPTSQTLSMGTAGCNFDCAFCQNHSLAHIGHPQKIAGERVLPEQIIQAAKHYQLPSLSYTYSEPTIFLELVYATGCQAIQAGLKNIFVSNGFASPKCLHLLKEVIHAANIDLKSFSNDFYQRYCQARLRPVLKTLQEIKKMGWWLEVTTLLIPGVNDSETELQEISRFIINFLGKDTPWHISRFHPCYKMNRLSPTPAQSLLRAWEIGKTAGLHFVYIGNMPELRQTNTLCPQCRAPLITRTGLRAEIIGLAKGRCQQCGKSLPGIFEL